MTRAPHNQARPDAERAAGARVIATSERSGRGQEPDAVTSRLLLEYDGGGFAGWASQPGLRTVRDEVERALAVVLGRPVPVVVAGRTDAGVHALGQVCSYEGEAVDPRSLNGLLPPDVAVLACSEAEPGFDARRDATSRAYCYRVLARRARSALDAGRVLHWPRAVEFSALERCAWLLVGTHDFTAFTPTETEHVRFSRVVLSAFWRREGEVLEFWIEADAFMRHMNRVLVGTMLEVAGGRRTLSEFAALLEGRPRGEAGPTAAAHGLYLAGVGYGGERVLGEGLRGERAPAEGGGGERAPAEGGAGERRPEEGGAAAL